MEIIHEKNDKKGVFKAIENVNVAGEMIYTFAVNDKFIIDHTEVIPNFEGKGVGKQLLMQAVKYARENHLKILPLCPFAKAMFDRIKEIQDVLF